MSSGAGKLEFSCYKKEEKRKEKKSSVQFSVMITLGIILHEWNDNYFTIQTYWNVTGNVVLATARNIHTTENKPESRYYKERKNSVELLFSN